MVIRTGNDAGGTFASRPEASSWSRAIVSQYYRQGYVGEVQNRPAASKIFVWGATRETAPSRLGADPTRGESTIHRPSYQLSSLVHRHRSMRA